MLITFNRDHLLKSYISLILHALLLLMQIDIILNNQFYLYYYSINVITDLDKIELEL